MNNVPIVGQPKQAVTIVEMNGEKVLLPGVLVVGFDEHARQELISAVLSAVAHLGTILVSGQPDDQKRDGV